MIEQNVPDWVTEIKTYRKNVRQKESEERPAGGQRDHLMDATRYMALAEFKYIPPPPIEQAPNSVYAAFNSMWLGGKKKPQQNVINCGPAA